jgi:catechol 2,3-dioxygenase-like lactoylglutathione lyase family enzyme
MTAKTKIYGIHHITAITSSAAENLVFYENVLGLRLVKQTVNFDDLYTYHLYYSTERLKKILLEAGADVTTRKINAGHEITALDLETISQWIAKPNTPEQKLFMSR